MEQIQNLIEAALGKSIPLAAVMRLLPILLPIVGDLADGNPQLSTDNLNKLNRVLIDLREEYGL